MTLRRFAIAPLLALAIFACTPTVPSQQTTTVVAAVFDLASSPPVIPQPNDLVLQPQLNPGILHPANAQDELLAYFYAQHGYPPDQVLPIEFPITTQTVRSATQIDLSAPAIDSSTLVPCTSTLTPANCNVFIFDTNAPTGTSPFPTFAATYDQGAPGAQQGTLTAVALSAAAGKPTLWRPGAQYVYALRGGANGIKTTTGAQLQPSPTGFLLLFGGPSDFVCPSTNPQCPLPLLGLIHTNYLPLFGEVASQGFPLAETVVVGSFAIAPATTWVSADATTGQMPFPSDFLIDPSTGRLNAALDKQAPGLSSLDGFSTTAMILAPTSGPIQASTVRDPTLALPPGVFLYKIGATGTTATKVPDVIDALTASPAGSVKPVYAAEPSAIQSGGFAQAIGLQPAYPVDAGVAKFMLPPLEENTEYAVVVTSRVKDAAGHAISKTTMGQIELFVNPLCSPSPGCAASPSTAQSNLPGATGPQASGLEAMRLGLKPVIVQLAADTGCDATPVAATCVPKSEVQMAYTFRTQTISGKNATTAGGGRGGAGAIQISAIPYTPLLAGVCAALGTQLGIPNLDCTKPIPGTLKAYTGSTAGSTVADGFTAWGVDLSVPHDKIDTVYELQIATVNKIDDATGAFNPSPTGAKPELLTVLVAVGAQSKVPACTGPLAPFAAAGLRCAPLIVFQHGITTAKNLLLGAANTLVDAGNVVVAIDLPWHGQRTFCSTTAVEGNPNAACLPNNFCVLEPTMTGQALPGTSSPGKCRTGTNATDPLGAFLNQSAICLDPGTPGVPGTSCAAVPGLPGPIALTPTTGIPGNQGYPFASGQFFISANFFRTRDGMRQAWIDHTQLLQVVAPTPAPGPIAGSDLYNALLAKGIVVNPANVSLLGQSLGSIASTGSVAANPRFSKAVFNTNGGTAVDTFTNSPVYQAQVDALFLSLGVDRALLRNPPAPGSPEYPAYLAQASTYLTYINVLKLIVDPADPINAAPHVTTDPWPNLIPPLGGNADGSVAQAPKDVLAQYAICDKSVANPFNALVAGNLGLSPFLPPSAPGTGNVQWYGTPLITFPATPPVYPTACPLAAPHGFLLSWGAEYPSGTPQRAAVQTLTSFALTSVGGFLADPATPVPSLVVAP